MCVKFVFGMGSGLKPIFKKIFVCEVRFWDGFGLYLLRFGLLEQILANVSRIWASAESLTRMLRTKTPKGQILANVSRIWAHAESLTRMLRTKTPKV